MAWYRAGSVAVTNGSAAVTGAATSFVANTQAGEGFLGPDGRVYEIASVISATQLTLATTYQGSTAAGQAYALLPTSSFARDLALSAADLLNTFAATRDGIGQGLVADGSVGIPALRFAADQDTGAYRVATNQLGLAANGALKLSVGAGGVGIGVGTPTSPIHIFTALTTTTTIGRKDARILLENNSSTIDGGGEIILGAIADTATGRYASIGSAIQGNGGTGGYGDIFFATKAQSTDAAMSIRLYITAGGIVRPGADNTQSFGDATHRWSTLYAGTGSVNTSDGRQKQQFGAIPDEWLDAWGDVAWSRFKFNDAVVAKGADARWHVGLVAQSVRDAFAAHDLDARAIGLLCYDSWNAQEAVIEERGEDGRLIAIARPARVAGDQWGLRYDECFAIEAAWQRRRMDRIEARCAALEAA